MLNDPDFDLEDLESRLYGQVHYGHSVDQSEPTTFQHHPSLPPKPFNRYYRDLPPLIHGLQQQFPALNPDRWFFGTPGNGGADYYGPMGVYPINNVVVVQQPTPRVFPEPTRPENVRKRSTNKKRARKKKNKARKKEQPNFRTHYLTKVVSNSNRKNGKGGNNKNVVYVEGEADGEDEVVLVSSENEDDGVQKVKVETGNAKDGDDAGKAQESEADGGFKPKPAEDDDVIFVPVDQTEVILIDCEPETEPSSNKADIVAPVDEKVENNRQDEAISPDSATNDFIEDIEPTQNDGSSSGVNYVSYVEQASRTDMSESESSCGTSTPQKSSIFAETAFEMTLDGFESYICSNGQPSAASTPMARAKQKTGEPAKGDRSGTVYRNSSDSSSESDYDEASKAQLIKKAVVPPLPNLSPIVSADEGEPREGDKKGDSSGVKRRRKQRNNKSKQKKVADLQEGKKDDADEWEETVQAIDSGNSSNSNVITTRKEDEKEAEEESLAVDAETRKPKRFSDYWTDDMDKFYKESWNDENFSVAEAQKSMSDKQHLWRIIDRDRINLYMKPKGPRCKRCKDFGHKAFQCRETPKPKKCIVCGGSHHCEARCRNKICPSCGRDIPNDLSYCSGRCANLRGLSCTVCSMRGHTTPRCPDLWRRYHLTVKEGPLVRPRGSGMKPVEQRWCSGCASRGHYEHECNYYNRTHPPCRPFVHSYQEAYGTRLSGRAAPVPPQVSGSMYTPFDRPPMYHHHQQQQQPPPPPPPVAVVPPLINFFPPVPPQHMNLAATVGEGPIGLLTLFSAACNPRSLCRNMETLNDPRINWRHLTTKAVLELQKLQKLLHTKRLPYRDEMAVQLRLSNLYRALNAVMIGKGLVCHGKKMMEKLRRRWQGDRDEQRDVVGFVRQFEYVFNNGKDLHVNYGQLTMRMADRGTQVRPPQEVYTVDS